MDNIFSEIFGCYYKTITDILNNTPLTDEEVKSIIDKNGFQESYFHILPLLKELPFLEKRENKYYSLLQNKIKMPLTNIEKSWLKAIFNNEKIKLFENDFIEKLKDIEPIYNENMFKYYDKYADGDDYTKEKYISNFKKINKAIENKEIIEITYKPPKQKEEITGYYLPINLEYSTKDDKFRFFAARIFKNKMVDYVCINIGRITEIKEFTETFDNIEKLEKYLKKFEKKEVVDIEIYNSRNAIERFMIEFSTYEKQSEFNQETETCNTKIYYRKNEECEILMKILSFGPTIKVIAPNKFKEKMIDKINNQLKLIKKNKKAH